jgi:predicted branched-subunit amino acid permease
VRADGASTPPAPVWARRRSGVLRDALGVGVATGAYGVSFGAIGVAGGLSVLETCATSVLMFTGASQFALVGVVAAGGSAASAAVTAVLLGARNSLYGLRLSTLLGLRGTRKAVAAQLVIDESTAMCLAHQDDVRARRLAFWSTGLAVFVLWNLATLAGALAGSALGDPQTYGLDAAVPAAFLALLWPRLTEWRSRVVALGAAAVALLLTPVAPAGLPVMAAALVAVLVGVTWRDAATPTSAEGWT